MRSDPLLYPLTTLDEQLAWKAALTKALVSCSPEWLNVSVEQATAGARPRQMLNVDIPVSGLLSSTTDATGTKGGAIMRRDATMSSTSPALGPS